MATGKIDKFFAEKGFGFIKGDDGQKYFVHIRKVLGGVTPNDGDAVSFDGKKGDKGLEANNVKVNGQGGVIFSKPAATNAFPSASHSKGGDYPYAFVSRKGGKQAPEAFHDALNKDRLDVAFEVTWRTETPTALMPCEDPSLDPSAIGRKGENIGFNKRWLMMDQSPAISPFTVKGAVAGGVANILDGCFQVPDREEGHNSSIDTGTYPFTGKWKRYRVSMNGKSLPGIISDINPETGYVKVQPVIEYYWDQPATTFPLKAGESCFATAHDEKRRLIMDTMSRDNLGASAKRVTYYGPYRFGMNLMLKPGDMGKKHHHRFYEIKGAELSGTIEKLAFATQEKLLKKVYGGSYCKNDPKELKVQSMKDFLGKPWYEDLASLKTGDWCYYTAFTDESGKKQITAIGKNFQFKALFDHEKSVPAGNKACTDKMNLCPRCSLFGLADKSEGGAKEAVGYAGRFRASTLVSSIKLAENRFTGSIPVKETFQPQKVEFTVWRDGERDVIRQLALPIMGSPKPSKRDTNGYFDEATGNIKGAKRYHHVDLNAGKTLPALIAETDAKQKIDGNMDYGHQMRPVAAVCMEGVNFTGTIGGENCSHEEVAALLMLLDKRSADHGFKLGMGKSIGMGSVSSLISRVWVRSAENYQWTAVEVPTSGGRKELFEALKKAIPEPVEVLKQLINAPETLKKAHKLADRKSRLEYPGAGLQYWKNAHIETV